MVCINFVWHSQKHAAETTSLIKALCLPAPHPQFLARFPRHTQAKVSETPLLRAAGSDW